MKTFITVKLVFRLLVVIIPLVSCTKSDLPSTSYTPYMLPEAYIADMGPVNDSTWETQVLIRGLKYVLTNDYGTFLQSGSLLQVGFFSGKEETIPSGIYTFSDSTIKVPFTFNNAFLSVGGNFIAISSGSITVNSAGRMYELLFNCGLSDGDSFTAAYNGIMLSYEQYYK